MGDETRYYVYAVMIGSILAHFFLIKNLSSSLMAAEYFALAVMALVTIYIISSFEKEIRTSYFVALIFFAVVALNSLLLYFFAKDINYLFIGFLNVLGIYLTIVVMPQQKEEEFELPPRPIVEEIPEIKPHPKPTHHVSHKVTHEGITKKEARKIVDEIEEFIHEEKEAKEEGEQAAEEPLVIEEIKPMAHVAKKKKSVAAKESFVGSLKAKIYHTRACPRAKALPDKNKVVFYSKLEAEANRFKPHDCVRK